MWKRMPWGEGKIHSFSYTNDQVLYNQFSPYFLCRVSWLLIITNSGSLNLIRLNEYQLKSISFNYNICGIWKIFSNTRQRKYGLIHINYIGGVMVIVLALSAVNRGFEPRSGQTKDYNIGICCFFAKYEWGDMSTRGFLFQWASTIQIQLGVLV
jgi:hypothetical protein